MDASLFKTLGQIAGIGGIAFGVVLLVFRDVIRKNIFPTLDAKDAYKLIRLVVVLVFVLGFVGIGVWAWAQYISQHSEAGDGSKRAPVPFRAEFRFTDSKFNLSASPTFNYGFSTVKSDKIVSGEGIRIKNIRVDLTVHTKKGYPCCDVWVLLGPGPFGFQSGAILNGQNPFSINPISTATPSYVHFVLGNGGVAYGPDSEASLYATYDFESGQFGGNVDRPITASSRPLNLSNGLYAQTFLWNGNPNVDLDVENIVLQVDGTKP